ncbi:MAG: hypothetical protein OER77_07965 [Myxococcales bacterium]|nr:hypothetical protein [Myxococcales bacterium]
MTAGTGARPRPKVSHQFGLTFDETAWPLLYVRFPSKPLSDEGFEFFIARYTAYVEKRILFATILDSRGLATAITANQRRRLTEWFEVTGPLAGEVHFGIAVLFTNPLIRGALKAVTWLAPIPVPIQPFASIADAAPWVRSQFEAFKVPVTPAVEQLLAGHGG